MSISINNQALIENLLIEFYHPNTQNFRKHEIEKKLISLKQETNIWKESILNINNFNKNQFLWFFNTSILEYTITRKWHELNNDEKTYFRDIIWQTYINLSESDVPKRQRDTIAHLIVLIGKREFPDNNPYFIRHILELTKNKFLLGINLLRITSEEVVSVREDLPTERKKYFQSCVTLCLPEIFSVLEGSLVIIVNHLNGTNLKEPDQLNNKELLLSLPNDNHLELKISELLTTIQHLVSWIPLDDFLTEYFLLSILYLSKYDSKFSTIALQTINELFYVQRPIPLPNILMNGIKELLCQHNLEKSNEMYQDKFTELLRLFTTKYWSKLITDQDLFASFIFALHNYTFSGYGTLAFTEKLEIWSPIIRSMKADCYSEVLNSLVTGILNKMQLRFDKDGELECLDNETLDDNMETEWQHYITMCIETIAIVAEGRPQIVFERVFNDWQKPFEIFISLEKSEEDKCNLISMDPNKSHILHYTMRDLSSLCQTLVRLAPILEECQGISMKNLLQMTHCLIYSIKLLSYKKIGNLSADSSDLFAQILSALRTLLWMPVLKTDSEMLKDLINNVGMILLPSSNQESKIVLLAASQFLLSVTSIISPSFTVECQSIMQLIQAGPALSHLTKQIVVIVYEVILNCFVLPWQNIVNIGQNFEERSIILQDYITCLTHDFIHYDLMGNNIDLSNDREQKILTVTSSIIPILKEVIDYYNNSSSTAKQMLVVALKPVITKTLAIYSSCYGFNNDIGMIISDFCLSLLRTFQIQLGTVFVREMLTIFIESATKVQLNVRRMNTMIRILEMLQLIVQQPGSSTTQMLPSILSLAIDHIFPLISDKTNSEEYSEIALPLYTLFNDIMYHRWQYFYKSHVRGGFSPGGSEESPVDGKPEHSLELLTILTSYGHALVSGNDPHVRRTVLISLKNLNERCKLFHREFFKQQLLASFECALINLLVSNEGSLYYDLLLDILYAMGQADVRKLHESFLSIGFDFEPKLMEDICLATDLPTFSVKMNQLIQDTRYRLIQ